MRRIMAMTAHAPTDAGSARASTGGRTGLDPEPGRGPAHNLRHQRPGGGVVEPLDFDFPAA